MEKKVSKNADHHNGTSKRFSPEINLYLYVRLCDKICFMSLSMCRILVPNHLITLDQKFSAKGCFGCC